MSKIFVGNLNWSTTEEDLELFLEEYGPSDVRVIRDRDTGESRGFAFVDVGNADRAIADLDGRGLMGRNLRISHAKPKEDSRNGGEQRGRGRAHRE